MKKMIAAVVLACGLLTGNPRPAQAQWDQIYQFGGWALQESSKSLIGWMVNRSMDRLFGLDGRNKPMFDSMSQALESESRRDSANREAYLSLSKRIDDCTTVAEVREAIAWTVGKMDAKLGAQAVQICELQRSRTEINAMLKSHGITIQEHGRRISEIESIQGNLLDQVGLNRAKIREVERRTDLLDRRVDIHEGRLSKAEAEIESFRRWRPDEVAERGAVAGLELYQRGRAASAAPILRQALAMAPDDSAIAYILAMALWSSGAVEEAKMAAAVGIAAEHKRGPSLLWYNVRDRLQGPARQFVSSLRDDPFNGSRSSGHYRILEVVSDPDQPGGARTVQVSVPTK